MSGAWVLLVIILISSLPVIVVYVWFRFAKYQFSLYRFLFALLAGAAAFFPALVLQDLLIHSSLSGRAALFFEFFIRIAFTEELSRLMILIIFFLISDRITRDRQPFTFNTIKKASAIGLVAGLGFALIENATYAASDIGVLPLRIIITAAVHAACGSRIGAAAVLLRSNILHALLRILTATAIHGIFNMMIIMPGISPLAAILLAICALFTAILTILGGWSETTANPAGTAPAVFQSENRTFAGKPITDATIDKDNEN